MRINTNMSALRACYQLNNANDKLSKSLERLSSGYKINSAEDGPVGAAISQKLKTQIKGLDRAIQNASDGISVVETAEGALTEVTEMVQRMSELAIQGANGTMSASDRQSIMDEIEQLQQEIDRISSDTEFNTRGLINGELSRRSYTDVVGTHITYMSDAVEAGNYTLIVRQQATYAKFETGAIDLPDTGIECSGSFTVNGETVKIEEGDTRDQVLEKIQSVANLSDISVNYTGTTLHFKSNILGSNYPIQLNCTEALSEKLGVNFQENAEGTDAVIEPVTIFNRPTANNPFPPSTAVAVDGNNVTLSASENFEMRMTIDEGSAVDGGVYVNITALDIGTMAIQMGANSGQIMDINVPEVSCAAMGLDKLNLHTEAGCDRAISMCDKALRYVLQVRSKLGAYANRMEHATKSLDVTHESMTAALSRIEDADMAEEMTNFTSQQVITQAANSMLAQANQLPEKVLQLLQ